MTQSNFSKLEFLPPIPEALFPARTGLSIQIVNLVDLNKDGKKDIIFHLWSGNGIYPPEYYGAVPDALFVYLSKADGSYQLGNQQLFGNDSVKLGAASRSSVVADFNSDGYPDIAYAMNQEDGRLPETTVAGFKNWGAQTAVMMSNSDGSYRIDLLEPAEYNHTITSVVSSNGTPQILLGSPNLGANSNLPIPEAISFEWVQDHWASVTGFPKLTAASNFALSLDPAKVETTHIFSGILWTYNDDTAVGLYEKNGESWELSSQYNFSPVNDPREFVTWVGLTEQLKVFEVNHQKVIDLRIWESASIKLTPTSSPTALVLLSGSLVPDTYISKVYQNDLKIFNYFVGFDTTGGQLKLLEDMVQGQDTAFQSYRYRVADVNGDGYDDLVSYLQDYFLNGEVQSNGRIDIFLNDQKGHLIRDVDFTYPSMFHKDQILYWPKVMYDDLNGDGINDLLYYSTGPSVTSPPNTILTTPFEISWGTQNPYPEVAKLLVGDAANNTLVGGSKDDTIMGGAGDDHLQGGLGNDSFSGGAESDEINGGGGIDTLEVLAGIDNYSVTKTSTGYALEDINGTDGIDTLVNIEAIKFSDKTVNLTVQSKAATAPQAEVTRLVELYTAFFNRVPDADGMSFWIDEMKSGKTINQVAESFYNAGVNYSSLTGFTATMTNTDFINVIYKNVLGRKDGADADGLKFWNDSLTSGKANRGTLVTNILDSAHTFKGNTTWGWVADLLDNKITVAKKFSIDMGLNYNTPEESITNGMAIASAITPTDTAAAVTLIGVSEANLQLT